MLVEWAKDQRKKTGRFKIFITSGFFHHMNKQSFDNIISYLKWNKVDSVEEADIVYSPDHFLDTEKHPDKKFMFGNHFSVFPNESARRISNKYNNAVYIQPSQPTVDTWINEFSFDNVPVKTFPFPLDLDKYPISKEKKWKALLYYKHRDPHELKLAQQFLSSKNVDYTQITYGEYKEEDFQRILNKTKYVVCLGAHESQGFAIQSIMCKNIPLLVWGVTLRKQEYPYKPEYQNVKSPVSTVPYWDKMCGELFFNYEDFEKSYNKLIKNLNNYTPRKFIENNLTVEHSAKILLKLLKL